MNAGSDNERDQKNHGDTAHGRKLHASRGDCQYDSRVRARYHEKTRRRQNFAPPDRCEGPGPSLPSYC